MDSNNDEPRSDDEHSLINPPDKRMATLTALGQTRVLQFYGICKDHTNGDPKARPIVSSVNSTPEVFSKWVDYCWLKKVLHKILPTYILNADHLMTEF
jgi:hypothetical protein